MKRWEKWSFSILTVLVSLSGFGYLFVKYFVTGNDPFSVINHPLQPHLLSLHLIASPMLIFVMGIIMNSHVSRKLRKKGLPNRRSGWIALVMFPTMVLSGYLLPLFTGELASRISWILHLASGSLFFGSYVLHMVISVRLLRSVRKTDGVREARLAA